MTEESTSHVAEESLATAPAWKGTERYEILGCLGQGGMGVVYEAFDRQRRERVALKTLRQFDAGALYRFKQEFRTLADVLHPNLVHLHELVAHDTEDVFFAMELVDGTDFLDYVHNRHALRMSEESAVFTVEPRNGQGPYSAGPRPGRGEDEGPASVNVDFGKLRRALLQLVEGVAALHAAGKLHRDLKPSNVRVTPEGRVVIMDFGVATELRRWRSGEAGEDDQVVGTAAYMAPEQASGDAPLPASDWYSVGVMLYEAMVGVPPYVGSAFELLTLKCTVAPVAPSARVPGIPEDLDALCLELLSVEPENRPTASQILRRLGGLLSERAPAPAVSGEMEVAAELIGRRTHLLLLQDAFAATRQGRSVSARIAGLSGMGKSSVANHFLDELQRRGDILVLRGRAYERESVPYKAVDSVVDALSRHLIELEEQEQPFELPADIGALAQVFPVLRRIGSIKEVAQATVDDPRLVRQRAFAALRELFESLARRTPVVVFIDDVQWGDADSAALLVELLRPPGEPPLLLVTTHRAEEAHTSPFLTELRERWSDESDAREIQVGPLDPQDARKLAIAVLGARDPAAQRTAEALAHESGGNPFLLEELARAASGYHRVANADGLPAGPSLTLEQIIGERAGRLPDDARKLLEVIAVGGRPLPLETVREASGLAEATPQLVALLRANRFVRTGLRDGFEMVEASHDRIRQTVVGLLPDDAVRGHHAQLARVLELSAESDPEAIATHLLGAGDRQRAGHYAERAAEQAIAKLAFAQAARLFQLRIDSMDAAPADLRRLRLRMGQASEWAGHAEKAARAYLAGAEQSSPIERVDLHRAAAAQLIAAGLVDEGAAAFRGVLAAVGRAVPGSPLGILFWAVLYRILSLVLFRSVLRDDNKLGAQDKVRLEALHSAARALTLVDPLSAIYVKARFLVDALRAGSRFYVVRAAASEAGTLASSGGRESRRERVLFATAKRLAEESGDVEGLALYEITWGVSQYLRGRWASCIEFLDRAYTRLAALRRWQANASVYRVYALTSMGDLLEVKARTKRLLADAEQRGDLYTAVNLRASHPMAAWLAADDVEGARRNMKEALANWSPTRFLVQHWQCMLWETEAHLYADEGERAWQRLARDERRVRRSLLLRVQLIRTWTLFVRGRSAVASLEGLAEPARSERLANGRRMQDALVREKMPWTDALAALLAASLANVSGDAPAAEQALRRAIELAGCVEMAVHAAAARFCLGSLVGGEAGATLRKQAEDAMREHGVRVPHRYARMLVPGIATKG
jgi:serine/threonine protein kinase